MQRNFTNDDFERFLKRSADGLRMRPSDQVWKGISSSLNKRKRRITYFGLSFLAISSVVTFLILNNPEPAINPLDNSTVTITNTKTNSSNVPVSEVVGNQSTITNNETTATNNTLPLNRELSNSNNSTSIIGINTVGTQLNEDAISEPVSTVDYLSPENLNLFKGTIVDSDPKPTGLLASKADPVANDHTDKILGIESVTNLFRGYKKNKLSFQAFFTPTISYRKLSENKSYLRSTNQPSVPSQVAALYNINDLVTHKPDMGLELGLTAKYSIAKSIKLRGGLQFNVSRYGIKAFDYSPENAMIALNNGANNVDYLQQETTYRRVGTNSNVNWLENLYFQVSAPIGMEVKLHSTKNAKFGIASTIQPTYVVSDRAYLLSYDYKNYTEVPWLIRKWNVNTSIETFVSYNTGRMQWQVGPQVRYQLLSSFVSEYPVKENLFDFGLKVGVSINKNSSTEINK